MPLTGFTIDGPSTRDIDDGIWVEQTSEGFNLTVVIADVSGHIHKGSPLDQEAMRRGVTRYFADGNKPMLPRTLSENRMSLLPQKYRRVMAARIKVDDKFQGTLESISLDGFKSKGRIDYPDIPGVIGVFQGVDLIPNDNRFEVIHLAALATGLMERRRSQGALAVYDMIQGWVTTEEGFLKQMKDTRETIGYIIIQEAMILTNALIAEWCVKEEIPVLYRNHTARPATPSLVEVNAQIKAAIAGPWTDMDNFRKRLHMLLDRADYGPTLKGHFGLSIPAYLHFTSPIRRYADLVNHRQIRAKLQGKEFPYTQEELVGVAEHINNIDREDREKEKAHFKARAEGQAGKALERGKLTRLNDKELERVLKVATKSGEDAPDALVEEFLARLAVDKIPTICMAVVCFHTPEFPPDPETPRPGWTKIRDAILLMLQEKPEVAISLWTLAVTLAKEEPLDFKEKRSGPDHLPVFTATARSGLFVSGQAHARTAKIARQRAAVWLLFRYHNLPEKGWLMTEPEPEPSKPPPFLKNLSDGRDPIVALMEYAQKNKLTTPSYDFKQEGPSHMPTITCTCSFNRRTGVGTASNKKEAKRLATQKLVDNLVREHDHDRNWVLHMAAEEEAAGGFPGETGRMSLQGALDSMAKSTKA